MRGPNKNSRIFLITAGPTIEDIDPVRFISNRSSGKLGVAIATEAIRRGHSVYFIHGPISEGVLKSLPKTYRLGAVPVRSAAEMHESIGIFAHHAEVIIMNAAVADFTPEEFSAAKIKKSAGGFTLRLKPTVDIL